MPSYLEAWCLSIFRTALWLIILIVTIFVLWRTQSEDSIIVRPRVKIANRNPWYDKMAFLLIRLKKYLNPHENSCSKVIGIKTTGNILHESSSQISTIWMVYFVLTPRCFAYRHAATTFYQLQRGFGGRRQHARIQEFLSVFFTPQLILQFTEGVQWFYCWENYTYTLPRIQRGSSIFQGVSNLFVGGGGLNPNFSRNPYTYLLFSRGGCPDPLSPSGSAHGQYHHNGTIFITFPLLIILVRHWFVRINDRWGFPNDALVLRTFDTFEKHSSWKW